MHDLFELGMISVKEIDFYPTEGCEFFVTLGKQGQGAQKSWLEMLEAIDAEIKAGIDGSAIAPKIFLSTPIQTAKKMLKRVLRKTRNLVAPRG